MTLRSRPNQNETTIKKSLGHRQLKYLSQTGVRQVKTDRQTERQTERRTHRQTHRHTDTQKDRQTKRQTDR